jgi:hypothetical protein
MRARKAVNVLGRGALAYPTVSGINVDDQIATAPPNRVLCAVLYSPDESTVRGALTDGDETLNGRLAT